MEHDASGHSEVWSNYFVSTSKWSGALPQSVSLMIKRFLSFLMMMRFMGMKQPNNQDIPSSMYKCASAKQFSEKDDWHRKTDRHSCMFFGKRSGKQCTLQRERNWDSRS